MTCFLGRYKGWEVVCICPNVCGIDTDSVLGSVVVFILRTYLGFF